VGCRENSFQPSSPASTFRGRCLGTAGGPVGLKAPARSGHSSEGGRGSLFGSESRSPGPSIRPMRPHRPRTSATRRSGLNRTLSERDTVTMTRKLAPPVHLKVRAGVRGSPWERPESPGMRRLAGETLVGIGCELGRVSSRRLRWTEIGSKHVRVARANGRDVPVP
jgi:hypothetical protein